MTQSLNKGMITVFVEQPLAFPRSAKNVKLSQRIRSNHLEALTVQRFYLKIMTDLMTTVFVGQFVGPAKDRPLEPTQFEPGFL